MNNPRHYEGDGEVTCARAMRSMTSAWGSGVPCEVAYWAVNAFKYLWRFPLKGNRLEDLRKAADCAKRAYDALDAELCPAIPAMECADGPSGDGCVWVVDGRTADKIAAGADEFPLAVFDDFDAAVDYLDDLVAEGGDGIVAEVPAWRG